MVNRYLPVGQDVESVFYEVLNARFPGMINIKFKLLMDTKKRMKKGRLTLASTELANEKIKYFSADDASPEGVDYIIILDSVAWEYAQDDDKRRIISHELCHVFVDEKGKYKLIDHDITDFIAEIKRNEDKPDWVGDLGDLVNSIYDQEKEMNE